MLNGSIEFVNADDHADNFSGFIKLNKDPSGESLSDCNMIFRG